MHVIAIIDHNTDNTTFIVLSSVCDEVKDGSSVLIDISCGIIGHRWV